MVGKPCIEGLGEEQLGCSEVWLGVWIGRDCRGAVVLQYWSDRFWDGRKSWSNVLVAAILRQGQLLGCWCSVHEIQAAQLTPGILLGSTQLKSSEGWVGLGLMS